jgi:integrase/recombinase XerD
VYVISIGGTELTQKLSKKDEKDYYYPRRISNSKKLLKKILIPSDYRLVEKFDNVMTLQCLADATKSKSFETILSLSRLLSKKNWIDLTIDDIDSLVTTVMRIYSKNGQETNTTYDHKKHLKIWFRWLRLGDRSFKNVGDPPELKNVKTKTVPDKIVRESLVTEDEIKQILNRCLNPRDRAMLHVHYDAGTRIGELLSLKIKHVKVDQHGMIISVDGKTGARPIRLLESVPNLSKWLSAHPFGDDPEAYLWINLDKRWYGQRLHYDAARKAMKKACKRAKITKRINLHLFRHSEATRTASFMSDSISRKRHGWSATSKMPSKYAHINQKDVDDVILKHHGIVPQVEASNRLPRTCSICKTSNSVEMEMCENCGKPLSLDKAILLEDESQKKMDSQNEKIKLLEKQNQESQVLMKELLKGQQRLQQQMQQNTAQQNEISSEIGKSNNPLIHEVWDMVPAELTKGMTRPPINPKIIAAREKLAMLQSTGL